MRIEHAPNLTQRIHRQQAIEKEMEISGNTWKWTLGDYTNDKYNLINNHTPTKEITYGQGEKVVLKGYEVFLYNSALNLLKTKKTPVVMLDLGGGAGVSFNRLALALQDEIRNSQLALVISNLAATPEQQVQRFETLRTDTPILTQVHDTAEARRLVDDTADLVHFVNGNALSLRMKQIALPNGSSIKLEDNIDFISEIRSLTKHTKTPELDLITIGFLLSRYGIYLVHNNDVALINDKAPFLEERRQGIQIGHRLLENSFGLQRVSTIETGPFEGQPLTNHHIFKSPQTPPITIQ